MTDNQPATQPPTSPRIGVLWGDFPWHVPPRPLGPLLSWGAVARTTTRVLGTLGQVVPYPAPPADAPPEAHRAALAAFLGGIDLLWADVYPTSAPAIQLRHELDLACPAVLVAGGAMPKGAEAMLLPWQGLLRPGDGLLFSCAADQAIWRRLVWKSCLHEWVAPLAIDDTVFHPRPDADRVATRARHSLPLAAPLLLYVGRLNLQKNLHGLVSLLAAVRRAVPDAHLALTGPPDRVMLGEFGARNTGYVDWVQALAAELGVAGAITVTGPLFGADLARLYAAADVLVNLSFYHRENFGLAQAEAQACGLPVVCSAWGGFKDVVCPGETGYLVEAVLTERGVRVDWATAARHVVDLLTDPAARVAMSQRAAAWARARFSLAAVVAALAPVVVTAGSPPASPASDGPAYTPSPLARRYEAHKRARGWYGDETQLMFQGRDYRIYERLLGPYATRLARDLSERAIQTDWRPYFPNGQALDPVRQRLEDRDPIWPGQRYLTPLEWEIACRIDGTTTVGQLASTLAAAEQATALARLPSVLHRLHRDGFILFQQ